MWVNVSGKWFRRVSYENRTNQIELIRSDHNSRTVQEARYTVLRQNSAKLVDKIFKTLTVWNAILKLSIKLNDLDGRSVQTLASKNCKAAV